MLREIVGTTNPTEVTQKTCAYGTHGGANSTPSISEHKVFHQLLDPRLPTGDRGAQPAIISRLPCASYALLIIVVSSKVLLFFQKISFVIGTHTVMSLHVIYIYILYIFAFQSYSKKKESHQYHYHRAATSDALSDLVQVVKPLQLEIHHAIPTLLCCAQVDLHLAATLDAQKTHEWIGTMTLAGEHDKAT